MNTFDQGSSSGGVPMRHRESGNSVTAHPGGMSRVKLGTGRNSGPGWESGVNPSVERSTVAESSDMGRDGTIPPPCAADRRRG